MHHVLQQSSLHWLILSFFYPLCVQWSIFPTMERFLSFMHLCPRCVFAKGGGVKYGPAQRNVAFHLHLELF